MRKNFFSLFFVFLLACGLVANAADADKGADWKLLFDGKTLKDWQKTDFAGGGPVEVKDGQIVIGSGESLSGINYTNTNAIPYIDYEIELEAKKIDGSDFFCGLTFPVNKSNATLVLGGWGGSVVGISSIDGADASENETTKYMKFEKDRWFKVRVRVTSKKIEAWLNDEPIASPDIAGRRISMRPGDIELAVPIGISTYQTSSAFKNVRIRKLTAAPASEKK